MRLFAVPVHDFEAMYCAGGMAVVWAQDETEARSVCRAQRLAVYGDPRELDLSPPASPCVLDVETVQE